MFEDIEQKLRLFSLVNSKWTGLTKDQVAPLTQGTTYSKFLPDVCAERSTKIREREIVRAGESEGEEKMNKKNTRS